MCTPPVTDLATMHMAGMQRRTYAGGAAKVDERPVMLLGAAQNVVGLDVPVGVPKAMQLGQGSHRVDQRLHARPDVEQGAFTRCSHNILAHGDEARKCM